MPHAFIIKPEAPYHMRGKGNKFTSASCGIVDYGEILAPQDFEGLYAGSPEWCCIKCRKFYDKTVEIFIKK